MYFNGDAENTFLSIIMYLNIASTYIYNDYPKLKSIFGFWSHRQTMPCFECLMQKYFVLGEDTNQVSISFLIAKDKNE